jgi:putative transposase
LNSSDRLLWVWFSHVWRDWQSSLVIVNPDTVTAWHRTAFRSWGAPRIHGELLKLGIYIGETSVSKYLVRSRKPPSQTWRTFLENHIQSLVSVDFFTVPTIRFQILYVLLALAHERRRIVHFAVTADPTAEWTAHQLREAFPWDSAPQYLLRDRDRIFGLMPLNK